MHLFVPFIWDRQRPCVRQREKCLNKLACPNERGAAVAPVEGKQQGRGAAEPHMVVLGCRTGAHAAQFHLYPKQDHQAVHLANAHVFMQWKSLLTTMS